VGWAKYATNTHHAEGVIQCPEWMKNAKKLWKK